jgi:hypothetical protein
MRNTIATWLLTFLGTLAGTVQPAFAQQTLNITFGYFTLRGEDARGDEDVLNENGILLAFDLDDFNRGTVGAEWLVPLGEYIEGGAGIGWSRRTVPSVWDSLTEGLRSDVEQDLSLRIIPVSFTVRVLPLGNWRTVQPFLGAGLGIFAWRYREAGEFIDFSQLLRSPIVRAQSAASGTDFAPLALGGLRLVRGVISGGFEARYHRVDARLDSPSVIRQFVDRAGIGGFPELRIDLGGWTYQVAVGYRFGR